MWDAGPSGLKPKMVRSEREVWIDTITELANHIVDVVILEVNWDRIISLNNRNVAISKLIQ